MNVMFWSGSGGSTRSQEGQGEPRKHALGVERYQRSWKTGA